MGFSELFYYYIKTLVINTEKNNENLSGSVFINILDIARRVITLIIGIIIFKDVYEVSYFVCFSFICIGCIFIQFSNEIEKYFINTYNSPNLQNSSDSSDLQNLSELPNSYYITDISYLDNISDTTDITDISNTTDTSDTIDTIDTTDINNISS